MVHYVHSSLATVRDVLGICIRNVQGFVLLILFARLADRPMSDSKRLGKQTVKHSAQQHVPLNLNTETRV